MIYVIYGTDTEKARERSHTLFDALRSKKPDAASGTIAPESVTADKIDELTQSQGLFENKQIVFMDRVIADKEAREIILEKIDALSSSPNIFILFEGKLPKEILKKLEKKAEKMTEYELDEEKPKESSNFFAIADALGAKDKKRLWALLRQAMDQDAAPEEIHGILFWQAKSIALGKAYRFKSHWKKDEIDGLLSRLTHIYHRAHRGEVDFERELEKLALDI